MIQRKNTPSNNELLYRCCTCTEYTVVLVLVVSPTGLEITPAKTSIKSVYLNKTMETDIDAAALLACAVTKSRSSGEN